MFFYLYRGRIAAGAAGLLALIALIAFVSRDEPEPAPTPWVLVDLSGSTRLARPRYSQEFRTLAVAQSRVKGGEIALLGIKGDPAGESDIRSLVLGVTTNNPSSADIDRRLNVLQAANRLDMLLRNPPQRVPGSALVEGLWLLAAKVGPGDTIDVYSDGLQASRLLALYKRRRELADAPRIERIVDELRATWLHRRHARRARAVRAARLHRRPDEHHRPHADQGVLGRLGRSGARDARVRLMGAVADAPVANRTRAGRCTNCRHSGCRRACGAAAHRRCRASRAARLTHPSATSAAGQAAHRAIATAARPGGRPPSAPSLRHAGVIDGDSEEDRHGFACSVALASSCSTASLIIAASSSSATGSRAGSPSRSATRYGLASATPAAHYKGCIFTA